VSLWHDLEPAWPVGRFTWNHSSHAGRDIWESTHVEETGVISSARIVNMTHSYYGEEPVRVAAGMTFWALSAVASFSFEAAAMLSIALKMEALAKGLPPARSNI